MLIVVGGRYMGFLVVLDKHWDGTGCSENAKLYAIEPVVMCNIDEIDGIEMNI